jgi:hypothetical protein
MKRHGLITVLASACTAAAPLLLWSAVNSLRMRSAGAYVMPPLLQTWLWQIVGLFPTPAAIAGLGVFIRMPGSGLEGYVALIPLLMTLQLIAAACSAALAYGLWRQLPWARWAMMIVCGLDIVTDIAFLFRYPLYGSWPRQSILDVLRWIGPFLNQHGGRLASVVISGFCLVFLVRHSFDTAQPALASNGNDESAAVPEKAVTASRIACFSALGIPVMVVLLIALAASSGFGNSKEFIALLFWLLLIFLPYGIIAWRLWRGPDRFGLGFASGLGLLTVASAILYAPVLFVVVLLGWGWGSEREKSSVIVAGLLLIVIAALHLFLLIGAARASILIRGRGKPSPAAWGAGFAVPLAILLVLPGLFQQNRYSWQARKGNILASSRVGVPGMSTEDLKHQKAAKTLVRAYARCAFAYSGAHPEEGFPREAAKLGPGGSNCLDASQLAAQIDGYTFHYQAFSSARSNSPHADELQILALPEPAAAAGAAKPGFLADQTGQIRNVSLRAAIASAPAKLVADSFNYSPTLTLLYTLSRCLNRARFYSDSDEYPQTLDKTLSVEDPVTHVKCVADYNFNGADPAGASNLRANHLTLRGYVFSYAPDRDAAGRATRFSLEARPERYADEEFRSYRVDQSGIIRFTPMDRAAASSDPEVPLCDLYHEACEVAAPPTS